MKIIIFGASGSGTTTLAHHFSIISGFHHLDSDDYYWLKSERHFEFKRDPQERNTLFIKNFELHDNVVVSGPVFNWNERFFNFFDLVVFLWIPPAIRIKRLIEREKERYGDLLETDEYQKKKYKDFIKWSSGYDQPGFPGRSFELHTRWMNKLQTPIIRIEGDTTIKYRIELIVKKINALSYIRKKTLNS